MNKQEFIIKQLKPYLEDPSICGYEGMGCRNLTSDGRMCVAGKNLLPEVRNRFRNTPIDRLLDLMPQNQVLIPESVGVLTTEEWGLMQLIHDGVALSKIPLDESHKIMILKKIENLEFVSTCELMELKELTNKLQINNHE